MMNKTGIEWCDYSWNPVTGCNHGCSYCYARKLSERFHRSFKPQFHKERLPDPEKITNPSSIFVVSMGDLFGDWVPQCWQHCIFDIAKDTKQHEFIFLTKNPWRMKVSIDDYFGGERFPHGEGVKDFLKRTWFGVSVVGYENPEKIETRISALTRICGINRFVSFEPLLSDTKITDYDLDRIKGVIVGLQTNPQIIPEKPTISRIVRSAKLAGTKVFFKNSMKNIRWEGESTYLNVHELCWNVHK